MNWTYSTMRRLATAHKRLVFISPKECISRVSNFSPAVWSRGKAGNEISILRDDTSTICSISLSHDS